MDELVRDERNANRADNVIGALDKPQLHEMLHRMLRIRLFEERASEMHAAARVPGPLHTAIGQEGEVVGACMALRADDYMTGNHRSHGHPIGKGAELKPLMAELLGKKTGVCGGKGGSMHLADFSVGSLGESGVVGSGMPLATGAGLSSKLLGLDRVCLCFFGDGAANCGAFHESLNLASIWKLPVIYLCENNGYAVTTSQAVSTSVENIAQRAVGYNIPGAILDGQDVLAVYHAVSEAARRARAGEGPTLLEAKTYRFKEHAELGGLKFVEYRSEEEIERWRARDPIELLCARLRDAELLSEAEFTNLRDAVAAEVDEAEKFAEASPWPDPEALFENVYA